MPKPTRATVCGGRGTPRPYVATNGHCTLRYCDTNVEFARFPSAADKRCYTSLLICPAVPARKSHRSRGGSGCVGNDGAKVQTFSDMAK